MNAGQINRVYFHAQAIAEDEFADLIEAAYLAGIIAGEAQMLAYQWLRANHPGVH